MNPLGERLTADDVRLRVDVADRVGLLDHVAVMFGNRELRDRLKAASLAGILHALVATGSNASTLQKP